MNPQKIAKLQEPVQPRPRLLSSAVEQPGQKVSRIDYSQFNLCFSNFVSQFEKEIDFYFKSYNRFMKEQRSRIELQGKDDKKKRKQQFKILESQEIQYWSVFPRQKKFYNKFLAQIAELVQRKGQSNDEVRDVEQIISAVLDYLPSCSKNYCVRFSKVGTPMENQRKITFDQTTQQLTMFDSEENSNWLILAQTITTVVGDILGVVLEPIQDASPLTFSSQMTNRILNQCKLYSALLRYEKNYKTGSDEKCLIELMYDQIQFVWSNKVFSYVSKSSKSNFDACLKFMQQPVSQEHKKLQRTELEACVQQIYFCRYLQIAPQDMDTGTKVLNLLDMLLQTLNSKVDDDFKRCLLSTLKYLIEQLWFGPIPQTLQYDIKAMEILQERVTKIFAAAEKIYKKENSEIIQKEKVLEHHALLLMAQIIKVQSSDFIDLHLKKFFEVIKISSIFQTKKYHQDLQIFVNLCLGGPVHSHKYKAWQPKIKKFEFCLQESDTSTYTPVEARSASLSHVRVGRKLLNTVEYFELIFNPKHSMSVEHAHWQMVEQLCYDNLEFMCSTGIPYLLQNKEAQEFLVIGLKLCRYILDPSVCFQVRYKELHPNSDINNCLSKVKLATRQIIKNIIETHQHSDYVNQCLNFFRQQSIRLAFQDQPQAVYNYNNYYFADFTKSLKAKVQCKFYLQDKARQVTLEDMKEMQELDFSYQLDLLNQIEADVQHAAWDKKREQFIRNRIQCHLAESPDGQRQNQTSYQPVPIQKQIQLEILSLAVELQSFVNVPESVLTMPCRPLTDLNQRVTIVDQNQPENNQSGNFLQECECLTPTYWLLSLDFKLQNQVMKSLQSMMVLQPVQVRLALLDQICYLLKEVMLKGPDDDKQAITLLLFTLHQMIKTWYRSEMTKLQIQKLEIQSKVYEIPSNDAQSLYSNLHVFQLIDMFSFLAICNSDLKIRQIGCMLQVNVAKLNRLIVHKDRLQLLSNDLIYRNQGLLKKNLYFNLTVANNYKGQTLPSDLNLNFYQILTDNFEYQKLGLNESQVRDIQVILTGDFMRLWKKELLKLKLGPVILNFMHRISSVTVSAFESRQTGEQNQETDIVGFNLLLAVVIQNICKSQSRLLSEESSEEVLSSGNTKNTLIEEARALVSICESNFSSMHKIPFGKLHPSRIWTSNVVLSFLYYLQDDLIPDPKSFENLQEIFLVKRINFDDNKQFGINCILFHTLLSQQEAFFNHVSRQIQIAQTSPILYEFLNMLELIEKLEKDQTRSTVLKICLTRAVTTTVRRVVAEHQQVSCEQFITVEQQEQIMAETRQMYSQIEKNKDLQWLCPVVKEIWFSLLSFDKVQVSDLKFLIQMEQSGFTGSINFFKNHNGRKTQVVEQQRTNDVKLLTQYVYFFYTMPVPQSQQMLDQPHSNLVQTPASQKNVFFNCLIQLIDCNQLKLNLENKNIPLADIQSSLARALINAKTEKLVKNGIVSKLFLVCLFMSVNSTDKKFIEHARVVCLVILPLMFDQKYGETVEQQLRQTNTNQLVNFENRQFFQFIKRVFKDEESYNMQHHFEKYFSLSGFLRDLLNELIKLQSVSDPVINPTMLLKVLDMVTYLFTGNLALRRSPVTDDGSFVFENLIDYKSFEFLSKLYKISERLVDYDAENMTVMNMWYKICEGRESNFEVLAKFLVHNLSSQVLKLKKDSQHEIEYEKHKRYSLSIFNYIKARTQKIDVRNSLNINSVTWSQKMLKIVLRAKLNLQTKYTLEKVKLKSVLEQLHNEINQSGYQLKLRAGVEQIDEVMKIGQDDVRKSVSMSQLLQSKTFLKTFKAQNSDKQTLNHILFIIRRQMSEKFKELTPEPQMNQLPQLVIRYFENTLTLIANESERIQLIKFTAYEEIVVTTLAIVVMSDLALNQDLNKAYFLYDLLNKLSVNVSGVQKYLRITTIPVEQFCRIRNCKDIFELFNYRNTLEVFQKFTSVYFKILQNLINTPELHAMLNEFWQITVAKLQESCFKENTLQNLIGKKQIVQILQVGLSTVHQISMTKQQCPLLLKNFCQTLALLVDVVQPPTNYRQSQFLGFSENPELAFSTNVVYWTAYCFVQTGLSAKSEVTSLIQSEGILAFRRLFEESEFIKTLLNVQKLSPQFSSLKLKVPDNDNNSILRLIFLSLENPKCSDNAYRCLMVTIKAQDTEMITQHPQRDEMHRLLLLLPYLTVHFTQETGVFGNKRSVVQLLKKSLPSISINYKKEILVVFDDIQREVDQNDTAVIQQQLQILLSTIITSLQDMEYGQNVIQSCFQTFQSMIDNKVTSVSTQFLTSIIEKINITQVLSTMPIQWPQEFDREPVSKIPQELRSCYFGLKNIILKEIENEKQDCELYFLDSDNPLIYQPEKIQKQYSEKSDSDNRSEKLRGLTKKQEMITKYKNSQQLDRSNRQVMLESPEEFKHLNHKLRQDNSPDKTHKEKSPKSFAESVKQEKIFKTQMPNQGTFAKQPNYRNEMSEFDISQQISSISIKPTDQTMELRPGTGQFKDEFDFQLDGVKQKLQTQKFARNEQINKLMKSNSSEVKPKNKLDFLLEKIRSDDEMLFALETFLESKNYDLDVLAFYIKVLEFKGDEANMMLAAGLIIDNYLGEEAEYYIGSNLKDKVVKDIEQRFEACIKMNQVVSKDLFDEATVTLGKELEGYVKEFLDV